MWPLATSELQGGPLAHPPLLPMSPRQMWELPVHLGDSPGPFSSCSVARAHPVTPAFYSWSLSSPGAKLFATKEIIKNLSLHV